MTPRISDKIKEINKPSALHLTVSMANTTYVLGTLSFNSAKADTASILEGTQFRDMPKNMAYPPCLVDLCDMNHRPGRIQLWNGWDFLVVTCPLTCRILSPIPPILGNSYRLPNYQNVPAALTDLLMQANNLTKEDVSSQHTA